MEKGKVWLVGTGPGDIGLLTKRAVEVIEKADFIAYDALIGDEILGILPDHAKLASVGKRSGEHSADQKDINRMLLEEALTGKRVVRLKGGDPFVFGRGGEELELLVKNQIPFEIVPGVTSAAAVPAYAGIPVTHRDFTSSFHVITGHPRKDGQDRIDYKALVQLDATLIFLMGISKLGIIVENLTRAGMAPEVPAAVLERGTHACQRRIVSTVGNLKADVRKADIQTPAIIVVGRVCALADRFSWYEKRILAGQQIVVTRARSKACSLTERLREEGAQVLEFPAIETRFIKPEPVVLNVLFSVPKGKEIWITFVSPMGVEGFFELLAAKKADMRKLLSTGAKLRFAAVGQATADELQRYGWSADLIPEKYNGRELGRLLCRTAEADARICLIRAKEGSEDLIEELERFGRKFENIVVYETVYKKNNPLVDRIREKIEREEIRWVTFTSASTVKGFVLMAGNMDYARVQALCIGEQTAREAKKYGMQVTISERSSISSMIDKIIESREII